MVSIKVLALLTLSATAVTAVPQYNHQRFHRRGTGTGADFAHPTGHAHGHEVQNDTENGPLEAPLNGHLAQANLVDIKDESTPCLSTHTAYTTSVDVVTVTAPVRRWDHTRHWGGQWSQVSNSVTPVAVIPDTGATAAVTVSAASSAVTSTGNTTFTASGGRKGLSYNSNTLLTQFANSGASWVYNWASSAGGAVPAGVEFVPMCWGEKSLGDWSSAVSKAIAAGAKHVLSFNEPDHPEQANMDASRAAQLHKANLMPLRNQGIQVISPAITNSVSPGQGLDWMKAFLAACGSNNGCGLDALAIHWYNLPGTFQNFEDHIDGALALASANGITGGVWLTEFAVTGSLDQQATFVKQAIPYLESKQGVARYAYFMVGDGQLTTGGSPNAVGKAYGA